MRIRFQIGYRSRSNQFFDTEDFKGVSFDMFKRIGRIYEVNVNDKVLTIEKVDAIFDMYYIKIDDFCISKIYCGFGDNVKNERIIKHLESLATGGRYPGLSPLFHMPKADYFLIVMMHLHLTEKEITDLSQKFYVGLLNHKLSI